MMDVGMDSMMAWMMGFWLLAGVVVIGLLIAILVVLVRLLSRRSGHGEMQRQSREEKPLHER